MEEIKPKKERKFLKVMGEVVLTLVRELLLNVGKKLINKSGNKRQSLVLAFIILASTFAIAQYPTTGNKQRLGYQTTGDGLVFRGRASDTTALKPSTINNAYHLFDTLNNILFSYIKTKGGWKFNNSDTVIIQGVTMPFDSITFNTAKDGTVGVGEVEYNDTQGSLIQGLKGGLVTNVIGQQLHQRVNNRTGATLTKGTAVYLSGSQGNRITVAKALGVTDAFSANTFGIVAENILHNQSGYVITEGLIKDINTSALVEDSAVYLSPTVAGGLTSTKPQAPQHTVYIGICVKSSAGSGELFCKIKNGQELDELHDVRISSPIEKSSLYYSGGLWRDTTAALLVSDTASMLTNYAQKGTGGTVTSVTGTLPISVINNTTTPAISIANASASVSGVVTTGTQSFAGSKTFTAATIINGGLVVNDDGSSVGTFRVEGNNNASLIQTSPNDDFVGIGRVPGNAFDVQGAVRFRTLTGNSTPTRIIGADATGDINQITLGNGLSLSAGVLSATSGGVTSVTASIPLSSTGGATPNITITDASIGASGVVNTTTQSFAGNKTFTGKINTPYLERNFTSVSATTYTVGEGVTWLRINSNSNVTLTLPSASSYIGKELHIKNSGTGQVDSATQNIVPLNSNFTGISILQNGGGKWATLVSNGTNWEKMAGN